MIGSSSAMTIRSGLSLKVTPPSLGRLQTRRRVWRRRVVTLASFWRRERRRGHGRRQYRVWKCRPPRNRKPHACAWSHHTGRKDGQVTRAARPAEGVSREATASSSMPRALSSILPIRGSVQVYLDAFYVLLYNSLRAFVKAFFGARPVL